MFNPTSAQVRQFFIDAWNGYRAGSALEGASKIAAQVMTRHPEYHKLLEESEPALHAEFSPDQGRINPFLHLSLHLAVEEHLAIGQPAGIRGHYLALLRKLGNEHDAQHEVLECLGETLWKSQRAGQPPDAREYLDCLARKTA
ncbi:MAG: DUF1841 family protein [Betaproteobacteria bacterium]|nr:DUF1841 family protein [Betaproteobacteria bacterium]